MVTPGADDDGIDSSLEGIEAPPYRFRLVHLANLSSTFPRYSRCAKAKQADTPNNDIYPKKAQGNKERSPA